MDIQDKIDLFRVSMNLQSQVMGELLRQAESTESDTMTFPTAMFRHLASAGVDTAADGLEMLSDLSQSKE
jgi:hypothetical protein